MKQATIPIFVPHVGCPNQCAFCDQRSISSTAQPPTPEQVSALCEEGVKGAKGRFDRIEIAFFGGSFTAIPRPLMLSLLQAAGPYVGPGLADGIRISTRPDAIDPEVLDILIAHGVTAIELGVQSMQPEVLIKNHRGHTPQHTEEASRLIRGRGLSLGHQMMTGLYGDTDEGCLATAEAICQMAPDTVRIYPTVVLRGTLLEQLYQQGEYQPPTLEQSVALCARLLRRFNKAGIRVIRMGLQASPELEQSMVAGVYHPAFRELCESRLLLQDVLDSLKTQAIPSGDIHIRVAPSALSKMVGQRRHNIDFLKNLGYNATVSADSSLTGLQCTVEVVQHS